MSRFMLGVLTMLLIIAVAIGVLFGLDKAGMIGLKPMTISMLGKIPGWNELPDELEVGKQQRDGWQEKEKTYQARVNILEKENSILKKQLEKAERALVEDTKKKPTSQPLEKPLALADAGETKGLKLPNSLGTVKHAARLLGEMKPQPAAELLMKIEPNVALAILDKVETRKAAKIIEVMPVERGSFLLSRLAEKK